MNRLLPIYISIVPLKFKLIFKAKVKLESGNQKIQYGRQAAILKVTLLKINRLLPMATINMHMKFEIEIPKETWLMLRKPCRLQTDGLTDGRTDKVNPVYPPSNFVGQGHKNVDTKRKTDILLQCKPDISRSCISRNWIYRGRMLDPIFWHPRARYFSWNRCNTLDPISGRQFFAKSAHCDSLCSRFSGDNFSRNQLWPTCQCGLEHMLCDGQPSSAEHWHLPCIAE